MAEGEREQYVRLPAYEGGRYVGESGGERETRTERGLLVAGNPYRDHPERTAWFLGYDEARWDAA